MPAMQARRKRPFTFLPPELSASFPSGASSNRMVGAFAARWAPDHPPSLPTIGAGQPAHELDLGNIQPLALFRHRRQHSLGRSAVSVLREIGDPSRFAPLPSSEALGLYDLANEQGHAHGCPIIKQPVK